MINVAESKLLNEMLFLATKAHKDQYDKNNFPYILHPISVMKLLNTYDIELMCIALGHDLLEDTYVTSDILRQIGMTQRIVDGIIALTKIDGEDYNEYKKRVTSNSDAIKVKIVDLTHNTDISRLKEITVKDIERTCKYFKFYLELKQLEK